MFFGTKDTFYSEAQFRYHSFPYTFDYHKVKPSGIIDSNLIFFHSDIRIFEEVEALMPDRYPLTGLPEGYCSYFFGDQAIGPSMIVYWFHEDSIDGLVKQENETAQRIFPRYIAYDPIYLVIESFCWEYFLYPPVAEEIKEILGETFVEQGLSLSQKFLI